MSVFDETEKVFLEVVEKLPLEDLIVLITEQWGFVSRLCEALEKSDHKQDQELWQANIDFREARLLKFYEIFDRKMLEEQKLLKEG